MIIYNPHNNTIMKERIIQGESILNSIPTNYCFITGSFLFQEKYKDIDVFVVSRTKKKLEIKNKKIKITIIDFNDLYSLFYHSIAKSCIAKNILPIRPLKVTLTDFWDVINEAIPTILNNQKTFQKELRFLVLYTEYFKTKNILDSYQLSKKIKQFKKTDEVLSYLKQELPNIVKTNAEPSYIKRFFYTQASNYKDLREYKAQDYLYGLVHNITRGLANG
ncbi:hypothetical protein HYY69_03300 [Candidatus Woesearchaeota archaeon]|nr:hypothetical protein [Candidatus Woesearchaeota archaeon]